MLKYASHDIYFKLSLIYYVFASTFFCSTYGVRIFFGAGNRHILSKAYVILFINFFNSFKNILFYLESNKQKFLIK